MDDKPVLHFTAGGKRQTPLSPDAAKAIAATRASKNQREGSPLKGLNPTAIAFQPKAAGAHSEQQIGDAANFMATFTWPASPHNNVRGSVLPQAEHSRLSAHSGIISGNSEEG